MSTHATAHTARKRWRPLVRGLSYSLVLALLIMVLGGWGFWMIDPRIHSLTDGIWLAFTTAATVGYGDLVPSTPGSRMFAVVVVLLGLAVLSLVTASLAALFVQQEERAIEKELLQAIHSEIQQLREEIERLKTKP
jgi:voltage-gated potassium channel